MARASFSKFNIRYIVLSKKEDAKGTWYSMTEEKILQADSYIKRVLDGKIIAQDDLNIVYKISGI